MIAWLTAHSTQIGYVVGAGITAMNLLIKLALWLHPVADWVAIAQRRPRLAALVRLLDALGISPISAVQAAIDLVRNEASKGTIAQAKALAVSASKPLISPPKGTTP